MREIVNGLRNIFLTDFIGDINLYTIISSIFKFVFVFIVLYYIYIIVKLIILDIKNIDLVNKVEKAYITFEENGEQKKYLLENLTTIGRSFSNDIVLDSKVVSKHHADIKKSDGSYYIIDLNSSNGTKLNGEFVEKNLELLDKDVIEIGDYKLFYTIEIQQIEKDEEEL